MLSLQSVARCLAMAAPSLSDRSCNMFADGVSEELFSGSSTEAELSDPDDDLEERRRKKARHESSPYTPLSRPGKQQDPKVLASSSSRFTEDNVTATNLSATLVQICDTLSRVVDRLDKTESRVASIEDDKVASSSSAKKRAAARQLPPAVRVSFFFSGGT